jgi:hypothetical protein
VALPGVSKKLFAQNTTSEIGQTNKRTFGTIHGPAVKGESAQGVHFSASPLLLAEPKKSSFNMNNQQSNNILLARIKESNILSNIDTDQYQEHYLS